MFSYLDEEDKTSIKARVKLAIFFAVLALALVVFSETTSVVPDQKDSLIKRISIKSNCNGIVKNSECGSVIKPDISVEKSSSTITLSFRFLQPVKNTADDYWIRLTSHGLSKLESIELVDIKTNEVIKGALIKPIIKSEPFSNGIRYTFWLKNEVIKKHVIESTLSNGKIQSSKFAIRFKTDSILTQLSPKNYQMQFSLIDETSAKRDYGTIAVTVTDRDLVMIPGQGDIVETKITKQNFPQAIFQFRSDPDEFKLVDRRLSKGPNISIFLNAKLIDVNKIDLTYVMALASLFFGVVIGWFFDIVLIVQQARIKSNKKTL